jgi:hypothetical protein
VSGHEYMSCICLYHFLIEYWICSDGVVFVFLLQIVFRGCVDTGLGTTLNIILLVGAIVLVNAMYYMVSEQCLFCMLCNILTFTILHLFVVEK